MPGQPWLERQDSACLGSGPQTALQPALAAHQEAAGELATQLAVQDAAGARDPVTTVRNALNHQPRPELAVRPAPAGASPGDRCRPGLPSHPHQRPSPSGRRGAGQRAGGLPVAARKAAGPLRPGDRAGVTAVSGRRSGRGGGSRAGRPAPQPRAPRPRPGSRARQPSRTTTDTARFAAPRCRSPSGPRAALW